MTGRLAGGVAAALGAAALYGTSPAAQARAASTADDSDGLGVRLTLRLARRPLWLAGIGCEVAAFPLEAFAFALAPATLVAPVVACDMLVFIVVAARLLATSITPTAYAGTAAICVGLVLLLASFGGRDELGDPATTAQLFAFLAAAVVAAALAVLAARLLRRSTGAALAFGVGSGLAAGLSTMAVRQVGRTFDRHHPLHLIVTPTPYLLAVCSVLSLSLMQRGLQANPVVTFPLVSATSALVPIVVSATLLHTPVPTGHARAVFVLALVVLATGLALLAGSRSSAEAATSRAGPAGSAVGNRPK